jgi:hypothetical protein
LIGCISLMRNEDIMTHQRRVFHKLSNRLFFSNSQLVRKAHAHVSVNAENYMVIVFLLL